MTLLFVVISISSFSIDSDLAASIFEFAVIIPQIIKNRISIVIPIVIIVFLFILFIVNRSPLY